MKALNGQEYANMRKKSSSNTDESTVLEGQYESTVEESEEYQPEEFVAENYSEEPAKPGMVAKAVYQTVYAASFGIVFSALLVSRLLVPKDSVVAKGLHDGSVAAHKAIEEKEILVSEVAEQTAEILGGNEPSAYPA